jgi:hypothetical protein
MVVLHVFRRTARGCRGRLTQEVAAQAYAPVHIDDAASPAGHHARQEGEGDGDRRKAVELDLAGDRAGVFVDEAAVRSDSGVVDQQVDRDAVRFQFAYQLRRTGCLGEAVRWTLTVSRL